MLTQQQIFEQVLTVINRVQQTALSTETVEMDFYLGGDLGIDSSNMLEIWYEIEAELGIKVHDHDKRDIYTLQDVVNRCESQLTETASAC